MSLCLSCLYVCKSQSQSISMKRFSDPLLIVPIFVCSILILLIWKVNEVILLILMEWRRNNLTKLLNFIPRGGSKGEGVLGLTGHKGGGRGVTPPLNFKERGATLQEFSRGGQPPPSKQWYFAIKSQFVRTFSFKNFFKREMVSKLCPIYQMIEKVKISQHNKAKIDVIVNNIPLSKKRQSAL